MSATNPHNALRAESFTIRTDGKAFLCPDCGANVFHWIDPARTRAQCNGCGSRWRVLVMGVAGVDEMRREDGQ
jgi:DNA-directed RNA polymerase subunit RPC12/RpoP